MITRVRASQLHPDVSGLVRGYTEDLYPNYSDIQGVSGITVANSGGVCIVGGGSIFGSGLVNTLNGLVGLVNVTGRSGIFAQVSGQTIILNLTGKNDVSSLNSITGDLNLAGYGTIDVWPLNATTIAISGIPITGQQNITSYISGGVIRLAAQLVSKINNQSGALTFVGQGGITVSGSGSNIYFNGDGINTGVNSINDVNGNIVLKSGNDISIEPNIYTKEITLSYNGHGLGNGNIVGSGVSSYAWFGDANFFQSGTYAFANGNNNNFYSYLNLSTLNAIGCTFNSCKNSTFINTTGSTFNNVSGSTFINGTAQSSFPHPYSFGVGNSMANSYDNRITMKALCSGGQMKPMRVAKTSYSGIFIPTGCAIVGHIDYVAARYNITDFLASFSISGGIYGRKYFTVQRNTNLAVSVVDQADFFGGNDYYGVFLSGGADEALYIWASGYGTDDVIFNASVQYSQFSFDVGYE